MLGKFLAPLAVKILLGIIAVLLTVAAVQTFRIEGWPIIGGGLKSSLAASERQSKAHFDAHVATITLYKAAQAEAARMEAARNERVEGEQERITDNVSQDYARDLAALRARYDRLRAQAGTSGGTAGSQRVPNLPDAAFGVDGAPGGDGFLSILRAADENTLRLMKLQEWVRDQIAVPVN